MKYLTEEVLAQVLEYIVDYQLEYGEAPTYMQIGKANHISSMNTVQRVVNKLYERGDLESSVCNSKKHISVPQNLKVSKSKVVKVIGNVACGTPITAVENIDDTITLPVDYFGNYDKYILRAKGDSMINKGINDGDLLVVEDTNMAEVGQIVIARVNQEEVTAKIFARDKKGKYYLKPANDSLTADGQRIYNDIYPDGDWEVCGIVRQVIKNL